MFSITNLMSKVSSFLSSANSLSNQIDNHIKKTPPILLGNIQLQLVSEVSESYSNDVPTVPIDDGTQIADNITPNPLELSFKVQIVGANHKEIFEKVIELRNKRELVDLYMVKLYKNMLQMKEYPSSPVSCRCIWELQLSHQNNFYLYIWAKSPPHQPNRRF